MKRRWIFLGFVAFFGLILLAWFARPGSLPEQIERQGIHMTSRENFGRSGPKIFYFVRHDDVPKLKLWLLKVGFKLESAHGPNMDIYSRTTSILGQFRPNSQRAIIWNEVDPGSERHSFSLYLDNEFPPGI